MRSQWVKHCLKIAAEPADFWAGCRKIIRTVQLDFKPENNQLGRSLKIADCGFTQSKLTMLRKNYLNPESHRVAIDLWNKRKEQQRYGSVGFTTYNHLIKQHAGASPRASVMGPCIQSVVITLTHKNTYAIDAFYRTTELFKKFPADLVFLRDELLKPFDFDGMQFTGATFHFANVTLHPMYFVTLAPLLEDPAEELNRLKRKDRRFYDWCVKWTARYICPENLRGIEKFSQAMRVRGDALNRIRDLKPLQAYLRKNHPGYRNDYVDPEDEE